MKTIQEILESHETDKHNDTEHSYGDAYADIFSKFDRDAEISILELGVQRGGSLQAWKEFFPNAKVVGIDISDSRLERYKKDNVEFILGDLKVAIEQVTNRTFDIIIDDSDHFDGTIAWIIKNYWPLLKPGGVMVIEDIQVLDRYAATIHSVLPFDGHTKLYDMRHVKDRTDDIIITLTKHETT